MKKKTKQSKNPKKRKGVTIGKAREIPSFPRNVFPGSHP